MLGVIYAILSAANFGLNSTSMRRGMVVSSAAQALYVTVILGAPLFILAATISGQLFDASTLALRGYLLLVAAGLLHFLFGRYCSYRAIRAIGATRSAPLFETSTVYAVLMAVIFLNEEVNLLKGLGIALIMVGPAVVAWRPRGRGAGGPTMSQAGPAGPAPVAGAAPEPTSTPSAAAALRISAQPDSRPQAAAPAVTFRLAEGYFFALVAATAFGTSPLLIRSALSGTGLGILGGLVAYSVAASVLLLSLALPGRVATLRVVERTTAGWLVLGAVTIFLAQMFRFLALSVAPVSVVTPLQRSSVIFTLTFSFLINRSIESFEPRVLAGIALAVLGSVAVVL